MSELLFLGTSSMVPTKERNQVATLLTFKGEGILFDCGEGTQRQFKIAGERLTKVTKILISHWHSDHVLGLPGLIQTLSASEYDRTLEIYGPPGTEERIKRLFEVFLFDRHIEMQVKDIGDEGVFFENDIFHLEARRLEHGIDVLGYAFKEKPYRKMNTALLSEKGIDGPLVGQLQNNHSIEHNGETVHPDDVSSVVDGKKIAYTTDTLPCSGASELAQDADVLICEATYLDELKEKADEHHHMTAKDAAQIASTSGAHQLVLIHFSARYKTTQDIEEEARTYFDNAVCAKDFMRIPF